MKRFPSYRGKDEDDLDALQSGMELSTIRSFLGGVGNLFNQAANAKVADVLVLS